MMFVRSMIDPLYRLSRRRRRHHHRRPYEAFISHTGHTFCIVRWIATTALPQLESNV